MSSETNHRAVVGAVLAVGAIGIAPIPVAAAAEPVNGQAELDARLFALIDEAREAGTRLEAASRALDDYMEAQQVARDRSGEAAANDRFDQLWGERYAACQRVANTRARTMSGLLAKLAFIAPDFDDESASELPAEMGSSPEILFSIAVDFKELKAADRVLASVKERENA